MCFAPVSWVSFYSFPSTTWFPFPIIKYIPQYFADPLHIYWYILISLFLFTYFPTLLSVVNVIVSSENKNYFKTNFQSPWSYPETRLGYRAITCSIIAHNTVGTVLYDLFWGSSAAQLKAEERVTGGWVHSGSAHFPGNWKNWENKGSQAVCKSEPTRVL